MQGMCAMTGADKERESGWRPKWANLARAVYNEKLVAKRCSLAGCWLAQNANAPSRQR